MAWGQVLSSTLSAVGVRGFAQLCRRSGSVGVSGLEAREDEEEKERKHPSADIWPIASPRGGFLSPRQPPCHRRTQKEGPRTHAMWKATGGWQKGFQSSKILRGTVGRPRSFSQRATGPGQKKASTSPSKLPQKRTVFTRRVPVVDVHFLQKPTRGPIQIQSIRPA